jgi:outer membrane translocation and assembly module TamA
VGKLRAVARVGVGNVWDREEDIRLSGLARGIGIGLAHPSRLGPIAVDFGVRNGGSTLFSISIGYPVGTPFDSGR